VIVVLAWLVLLFFGIWWLTRRIGSGVETIQRGVLRRSVPVGRPVEQPTIDEVPREFAAWESRLRRYEPSAERPLVVFGIEVRGRFPIPVATQIVLAASIFDLEEGLSDPPLEHVYSRAEATREPHSPAWHVFVDFGLVNPTQGFRQWTDVLAVVPGTLLPPGEGFRHYRVLVVAYDAANQPTFDHGMVDGDVLWAASHDFRWEHEGPGYRQIGQKQLGRAAALMEFAVAAVDPAGSHPATTRALERFIERTSAEAMFKHRFVPRGFLTGVLEGILSRASIQPLALDPILDFMKGAPAAELLPAFELAIELLVERGDSAGRIPSLLAIADRLGVPRTQLQAQIDKAAGSLAAGATTSAALRDVLGIDPGWDPPRVRAHLATL
jgi:hypothetical protein